MSCPGATATPASLDVSLTPQAKTAFLAVVQQATPDQLDASAKLLSTATSPGPFPLAAALASSQAACLRAGGGIKGWWASQNSTAKVEIVGGVIVVFGLVTYGIYKKKKS